MSQGGETFFTSVGCMDGRVQDLIAKYGRHKFGALFADTITEAGLVGKLARLQLPEQSSGGQAMEPLDQQLLSSLLFKIKDVSIGKHFSKGIVVHGHQECAGNPVDDNKHKDDIRKSAEILKKLVGSSTPIVGIFVKRGERGWEVEEILQTATV